MPADGRFRVLLFCGDISDASQQQLLESVSVKLDAPASFLSRFITSGNKEEGLFDIISIW